MERGEQAFAQSGSAAELAPPELQCRACELEAENARLRLLVTELLVTELLVVNQRLRERGAAVWNRCRRLKMSRG